MKVPIKIYLTVFCSVLILQGKLYICMFVSALLEHSMHSWSSYQIILFLTSKFIQGDGVFEQSKGEPEAVGEEMEFREICQ